MKIGIDISNMHNLSRKRGIGFYAENLYKSLRNYTNEEVVLIEKKVNSPAVDILHYPFFDFFRITLPFSRKIPTVVTIHDVIPLLFPEHYPPGLKGRFKNAIQRLSLKNVKAVITPSKSAKNDAVKILNLDPKKVFPVYQATSDSFKKITDANRLKNSLKKFNLPERFVLYSGNVNWNKNLLNIAEASLKADIDLVMVGSGFDSEIKNVHPELKDYSLFMEKYSNNPKIHILGFVTNDELVCLMNSSSAVLLPSFYEGFGFSIVEGQACGVPVVTSDLASMPEVAGQGAILVNPQDSDEISEAIKKAAFDDELRNNLIKQGYENVKRFSWEKTAKETLEVYKYVLDQ